MDDINQIRIVGRTTLVRSPHIIDKKHFKFTFYVVSETFFNESEHKRIKLKQYHFVNLFIRRNNWKAKHIKPDKKVSLFGTSYTDSFIDANGKTKYITKVLANSLDFI